MGSVCDTLVWFMKSVENIKKGKSMKKQRKHINISRITALILSVAMLAGFCPQGVSLADLSITLPKINAAENISNPRIVKDSSMDAGQKVTWDCVYFGSYPQSEITSEDNVYDLLQNVTGWDENNEITIGDTKYRRLKGEDATYAKSGSLYNYDWNDNYQTYHYFKYERIKWRILNRNGDDALLLADVALDDQTYNRSCQDGVIWGSSTMRSWLNGYGTSVNLWEMDYRSKNFINFAFTSTQRNAIKKTNIANTGGKNNVSDKVFLLSESEVSATDMAAGYGFVKDSNINDEARISRCSTYARAMGISCLVCNGRCTDKGDWWLRSGYVGASFGNLDKYDIPSYLGFGVRPALHLNLSSSSLYSYAGTVCSDGTVSEDTSTGSENPSDQITEDMLFTPEYCKYLNNTTYNKIFDTLWKDMSDVSSHCKWSDSDIAFRTVMGDGVSGQLKRIAESLAGLAFKKDIQTEKVQSALALDYVNYAKESSGYCAGAYEAATDSLATSSKVVKLLKKGTGKVSDKLEYAATNEDIKEFALALNSIFSYGDELQVEKDLKKILKSSEVMEKASSAFKISGKAISAYQVAVSIELLRLTTEQTQKHYLSLVDKDSTVYQGLKINYEKIKRQDAVNFALEMLDQDGITDIIGKITGKLLGTGTTAAATVAVADFIYSFLNIVLEKAVGVINIEDYLKVQYSLLDQSWLKLAVNNQRLNISKSAYSTKTLKNNYQDAFELYLSCILQIPEYMENYSGSSSYYQKLKKDVKKYKSKLTYQAYIHSCLQNANAAYSYTLSGDKATITKVNPDTESTAKAVSPFALTVMAMESEESYCLDIPSEIDGHEVEAIDSKLFENQSEIFAVSIPDSVKTIKEGAFKNCTSLTQVFLENGLETIEANAFTGCEDLESMNIPDTVKTMSDNAVEKNTSLEAASDSQAQSYAASNGNTFLKREKDVASISVKKTMDKITYLMSESLDLTGLELTVTYVDGTSEDIKEGYTGDFEEKQIGQNKVVVYYNGARTTITVQVNQGECDYTVLYQNACGEQIHEKITGSGTAGETIMLPVPEIDGYTPTEKIIKETLGETNIFKVVYTQATKKDISDASISYKNVYTETGREIKPSVEVRYKGLLLKEGTDYELEYNNNIQPGEGNLWISGIGEYDGIQLCNFVIEKKKVTENKPVTTTVKVKKIVLSGISKQVAGGKKITLKASVLPKNALNKKLKWKSSNTKVATVTQSGIVTLKKKTGGKKVIITVTAQDGSKKSASWKITSMRGVVRSVKISGKKQVKAGKTVSLKGKVSASRKANKKLLWTSSNTKIATVSQKGVVKANKSAKGKTVKITAMATDGSNKKATIKVKVR